jgi:hypothetical protein
MEKMKKFKFEVWIHPIEGGDDSFNDCVVKAKNKKRAEEILIEALSKRSIITDDYKYIGQV